METTILRELIALSIATTALTTLLGLLNQGVVGGLFLGVPAGIACSLCWGGFKLYGRTGLLAGVLLAAIGGYFLGKMFGERRGGLFVAFLWLGYCAACAVGYWAAGWVGWLTITLPSLMLFVYSLWRFSGRLLPIERKSWWLLRDLSRILLRRLRRLSCLCRIGALLWLGLWRLSGRLLTQQTRKQCRGLLRDRLRRLRRLSGQLREEEQRERRHRYQAFRALLTHSLGTNYPYYVVENGELQKRVDGNPFRQLFAGPGIVITNPHEAAVITDGMEIREIDPPGLVFTGRFDRVDQIVDLRTQLKTVNVDALTKDGIRIQIFTFVFFRIRAILPDPKEFWAEDDTEEAILQTLRTRPVDGAERQNWDVLPGLRARLVLQDIIGEYNFDDLCARDIPSWYPPEGIPYNAIMRDLTTRLTQVMREECPGIKIIGAGIANLMPADPGAMQQRTQNWRTEWVRRMTIQRGEGAREAMQRVAQARALAQAQVIRILTREAEQLEGIDKDVLADVLTLRLLEELGDMARSPSVQQLLSPETTETMERLRRTAAAGGPTTLQDRGVA